MTGTLVEIDADDADMARAVEQARQTLPRFFQALAAPAPARTAFLLKAVFEDGDDAEHVWMADIAPAQGTDELLEGTVANAPQISGLAFMQRVRFPRGQVSDWMYVDDGWLVGGYTTRALRARLDPTGRATYDAGAPYRFGDLQ